MREHQRVVRFATLVTVTGATPAAAAIRDRVQPAASSSMIRRRTFAAATCVAGSPPRRTTLVARQTFACRRSPARQRSQRHPRRHAVAARCSPR